MAVGVCETWSGEELDAACRAAIAHLGYGFIPPLSAYDREDFAAEAVVSRRIDPEHQPLACMTWTCGDYKGVTANRPT